MNRHSYSLIFASAALALSSCAGHKGYTLSGEVPEAWEGKSVVLYTTDTREAVAVDSTEVSNGAFELKGGFATPRRCRLTVYLDPTNRTNPLMSPSLDVYLDSTSVSVKTAFEKHTPKFEVTGGATMGEWQKYSADLESLNNYRSELFGEYIESYYKNEDAAEGRKAALRVSEESEKIQQFKLDYVAAHRNSVVSLEILKDIARRSFTITRSQLETAYEALDEALKASESAQELRRIIAEKNIEVGAQCPDLELESRDGKRHLLSEFVGKGRYTLIEIWASWCAPCRGDMPFVKRAYKNYHKRGFDIVSISINKNRGDWEQALDEEKMPWTQLLDMKQECFKQFETSAVPTALLLDPEGRICLLNARGGWLEAALEQIYDKK